MKKPFCKVCFDAGKSEKEYTSHYPRSSPEPTSKVVCPTLLSQECKYCKKVAGHTASYCPELAKAKKEEVKRQRQQQQEKAKKEEQKAKEEDAKKKKTKKIANKFSALDDEDDEEEEEEQQKQFNTADFPQLSRGISKQATAKQATTTITATNVATQLKSLFPELSLQAKFKTESFVNSNARQFKLVHKIDVVATSASASASALAVDDEYDVEVEEINNNVVDDNDNDDIIERPRSRPYLKASEMDWAAIEEDSDDEDW
jgi:hypothetical protein